MQFKVSPFAPSSFTTIIDPDAVSLRGEKLNSARLELLSKRMKMEKRRRNEDVWDGGGGILFPIVSMNSSLPLRVKSWNWFLFLFSNNREPSTVLCVIALKARFDKKREVAFMFLMRSDWRSNSIRTYFFSSLRITFSSFRKCSTVRLDKHFYMIFFVQWRTLMAFRFADAWAK